MDEERTQEEKGIETVMEKETRETGTQMETRMRHGRERDWRQGKVGPQGQKWRQKLKRLQEKSRDGDGDKAETEGDGERE